ncbi:MAG: MATE family efflux transporter [Bacteroidia bacterium]|nr:MATE family efflux transporter [Bacteroidia bacterium]
MRNAQNTPLTQDILKGDLWKLLWRFSLPAIIGMSINGINAFFDGLFVGQFVGQSAVAAISLAFPLTFITAGFSAMIGVGGSSILSQAIGSGNTEVQQNVLSTATSLSIIVSVVLMILGIYFAPEMIGFLGGTGEILDQGVLYYRITLVGAFFRIHAVAVNMLIRAEGKVKEAMSMSIVTALCNIVLNYIFMGILDLGIAGAAWATVASMFIFTIIGYGYYLMGNANYEVNPLSLSLQSKFAIPILKIGVSAMMMQIMFFVQQSIVFLVIKKYGGDWDIALMGTTYRVLLLMIFPSFGFAIAFQPIAGINYGAQIIERIIRGFRLFSFTSTIALIIPWTLVMLFPAIVLGWMLPEADFSDQDIFHVRMMLCTLPIFPSFFIGTTLFQATGEAKMAAFMTIFRDLALFVPFAIILPIYYGVGGIYYTSIPINIITIGLIVFFISRQFKIWRMRFSVT